MRVDSYMSSAPITMRGDTDYWKAYEIMRERNLHHIPVVNEDDKVVGILTRRDLNIAAIPGDPPPSPRDSIRCAGPAVSRVIGRFASNWIPRSGRGMTRDGRAAP